MTNLARSLETSFDKRQTIYVNGGSGLFLVDADKAKEFCHKVKQDFKDKTGDGASITCIVQPLPKDAPEDIESLLKYPLGETLALMRYRLREAKDCSPDLIAFPSHPFIRLCDACGIKYVYVEEEEETKRKRRRELRDPGEEDELYCVSCTKKRERDSRGKTIIQVSKKEFEQIKDEYLWIRLLQNSRK